HHPGGGADFPADRPAGPARGGKGLMARGGTLPANVQRRLVDASLAGLVTLVLAVPLVGLQTIDQPSGLEIATRWDWVAYGVVAVFLGRLLLVDLAAGGTRLLSAWAKSLPKAEGSAVQRHGFAIGVGAAIAFAFALPLLPFADRYVVDLGTTVLIYVMLGWGLNIRVGPAGLL